MAMAVLDSGTGGRMATLLTPLCIKARLLGNPETKSTTLPNGKHSCDAEQVISDCVCATVDPGHALRFVIGI